MSANHLLEGITIPGTDVAVCFPDVPRGVEQDHEWFEIEEEGERRRFRLHDYAEIFKRQGLYESLVYRALGCRSPEHVTRPLVEAVVAGGESLSDLRVADLGAGNGVVGELLRRAGVGKVIGIDILPEAAEAARRDRPGVYEDYVVTDLTQSDPEAEERLRRFAPNCLVTVAALGFGDIPPRPSSRRST